MVSLVALIVWHVPLLFVILGFLTFGALDGVYLSSALTKVPDGAWFTLILAVLLSSIFVLWRFGKEQQWKAEASDHLELASIIATKPYDTQAKDAICQQTGTSPSIRFTAAFGRASVTAINGMGIFFDKSGLPNTTPTVFIHFVQKFQATPRTVVFFHIRPLSSPSVPVDERFTVTRCPGSAAFDSKHQFFRVTIRHGYMDEVVSHDLGFQIYEKLRKFVIREGCVGGQQFKAKSISWEDEPKETSNKVAANSPNASQPQESYRSVCTATAEGTPSNIPEVEDTLAQQQRARQELSSLEAAYHDQVVYIVGKEQMRIQEAAGCKPRGWCRRIALAAFLWLRSNTSSKTANLNIDVDKLVEIGFVKII